MLSDTFITEHKDKLSKNHHTYDTKVFLILSRLDIGYYTFAFLDQYSRKKVSDIKTNEECKEEVEYIKKNFITINNKYLTEELRDLCKTFDVKFYDINSKRKIILVLISF